jgi:hypothetical protein
MSKRKPTFQDPKTGEEIESTALARWGAGLAIGLAIGLVVGLVFGLSGWPVFELFGALVFGLVLGLALGLVLGLVSGLAVGPTARPDGRLDNVRNDLLSQRVHDGIARWQHLRRQRLLRQQEFPHVPDGALSRADPPGEPEPTQASLSLAKPPEEDAPRLTASVEAEMEAEEQMVKEKT